MESISFPKAQRRVPDVDTSYDSFFGEDFGGFVDTCWFSLKKIDDTSFIDLSPYKSCPLCVAIKNGNLKQVKKLLLQQYVVEEKQNPKQRHNKYRFSRFQKTAQKRENIDLNIAIGFALKFDQLSILSFLLQSCKTCKWEQLSYIASAFSSPLTLVCFIIHCLKFDKVKKIVFKNVIERGSLSHLQVLLKVYSKQEIPWREIREHAIQLSSLEIFEYVEKICPKGCVFHDLWNLKNLECFQPHETNWIMKTEMTTPEWKDAWRKKMITERERLDKTIQSCFPDIICYIVADYLVPDLTETRRTIQ